MKQNGNIVPLFRKLRRPIRAGFSSFKSAGLAPYSGHGEEP
jgi:hypothetical protein